MDNDLSEIPVKAVKSIFVHQSQDASAAQASIFWAVQVAAAVRVPQQICRTPRTHIPPFLSQVVLRNSGNWVRTDQNIHLKLVLDRDQTSLGVQNKDFFCAPSPPFH